MINLKNVNYPTGIRTMKKEALLLSSVFLLLAGGCVLPPKKIIRGNGNIQEENRSVAHFDGVDLQGSMQVLISQDNNQTLEVKAESNLLPYLKTTIENGRLLIRFDSDSRVITTRPVMVHVSAQDLSRISLSGSGVIRAEDTLFQEGTLQCDLTGSGNMYLIVHTPEITSRITGSGDMHMKGLTRQLKISVTGSGDFDGSDLKSEQTDARITGSGSARVFASTQLTAHISGSGNIHYTGNPKVESHVSGSGKVMTP
jgi:hypothetical protein